MCNAHPRYLDFGDSQPCFVVFEKGKKLRDHAMRHFTSTLHWDGGWSKWAKGFSNIAAALDELRELGCPYQQDGFYEEKANLCLDCSLYDDPCGKSGGKTIDESYFQAVKKTINQMLKEPRYAVFLDKLYGIVGGPVVILTARCPTAENMFSVMTAYVKKDSQAWNFRDNVEFMKKKIKKESLRTVVNWETPKTWLLE